jgi:lipopolysaccharide biosynthesis protein
MAADGAPPAAHSNKPDRERRKQAALEAQQAGRFAEAVQLYQSVLDEEHDDFDALHMLGVVRFEQGQLAEAETLVRRAIAVNPNIPAARKNLQLIVVRHQRESAAAKLEQEVEAMRRARSQNAPGEIAPDVRVIAFYLPQYHPIPENSLWWGEGFTDWRNVRRASPNFIGHEQPHEPSELGYYDLRSAEVRERQAALAQEFGVHGFCYYVYWFNGKRLLHQPLDEVLASGRPEFPFCICWANENWTRRWDGLDREILISQEYSAADSRAFIRHMLPALADRRYIRVEGRPLVLVYKLDLIPDARMMTEIWREEAKRSGVGELYLCAARTTFIGDPTAFGFDACVEFPPHRFQAYGLNAQVTITNPEFRGLVFDYRDQVVQSLAVTAEDYTIFRTVMPSWDNTARRQNDGTIFVRSSPDVFEYWLREMIHETRRLLPAEKRLIFVNAWNEWAEGCHLEPDRRYGRQYLDAVRSALMNATRELASLDRYTRFDNLAQGTY